MLLFQFTALFVEFEGDAVLPQVPLPTVNISVVISL